MLANTLLSVVIAADPAAGPTGRRPYPATGAQLGAETAAATPPKGSKPAAMAAASKGPFPVWWQSDANLTIASPADCARLWSEWRPAQDSSGEPYEVEMTMPDDRKLTARTCSEWAALCDAKGYAYTTLDITMASFFQGAALRLTTIPALLPSQHSAFADRKFASYARQMPDMERHAAADRLKRPKEASDVSRSVHGNEIRVEDAEHSKDEFATVVARGDYNGDGWEDLVVETAYHHLQGSGRGYGFELFTQVGNGHLIPITDQLEIRPFTPERMAERRRAIADSFGLPEGRPIMLRGVLKDSNATLPVAGMLTVQDGFVHGSYQYDSVRKPIALQGSVGFGDTMRLWEFGEQSISTGEFRLSWKREGQRIRLEGSWFDRPYDGYDVILDGDLPPDPPPPPPPAQTSDR
jgi:hypothetical protein